MLPRMMYADSPKTRQQTQFAGLDHNAVVREGYLYDMKNLTTDKFPAISTRRGRSLVRTLGKPNGLFAGEKLCWVDGTTFYYDGAAKGQVADSRKRFARLGAYILIFPDKCCYNCDTDEFGELEARWSGTASFVPYTYDAEGAGAEVYAGNAIRGSTAFPFSAGEAVEIAGASQAENNRTSVIREILEDGKLLVFTNNTFTEAENQTLTLSRKVPDMDYFCENENRLWGCKGSDIYSCAVGNPFRWNNLEGLPSDSFWTPVGSVGDFTGAFSLQGYAIFFKEEAIHKMYGAKPSNFQVMTSAVSGVANGCSDSFANAGETLFYLTRNGVAAYKGGLPYLISAPLGPGGFSEGVGGSDGRRYYLSARRDDRWSLYCYDTETGLWCREDDTHAMAFARAGGVLHLLEDSGKLYAMDGGQEAVEWMMETGDFYDGGAEKAAVVRLLVRLELESGTAEAFVQCNSDGRWRPAGQKLRAAEKRTCILPIIPRRCDHYRIRIQGTGNVTIYGLARETRQSSMI